MDGFGVQGEMSIIVKRGEKICAFLISLFFLLFYVFFQSTSIYGGDAGDLVTASFLRGIAHPPGYPLYTFMGWLLTHLPFFTVAWRVTLLSSIPAAFTLGVLFLILCNLFQSRLISILTIFTLGFSYLFWLYASVPEVFMLHIFIVALLVFAQMQYVSTADKKWLYIFCLLLGLALAHHQTVVFLLPAFIYYLKDKIKENIHNKKLFTTCLILIILGFVPYSYVIWAAKSLPALNWENPQNMTGLLRLIFRIQYGTFRSHSALHEDILNRLFQVKLAFDTVIIDFTKLGFVLIIFGFVNLFINSRKFFWYVTAAIVFSGPIFFFYANFPSTLNFHLGTMERFLLMPYFFLAIVMASGMCAVVFVINGLFHKLIHKESRLTPSVFILLPLILILTNYPKISPLKSDQTSENMVYDILQSAPDNSLIFLLDDTVLFDVEYVYFTAGGQKYWRNIKIIQAGTIGQNYYQAAVKQLYKNEIEIPPNTVNLQAHIKSIVDLNYNKYPILAVYKTDIGSEYTWVGRGLLLVAQKKNDLIAKEEYILLNNELFDKFHNPLSGALSSYKHVMLADTLRIYANALREIGEYFARVQEFSASEKYLSRALVYQPENQANFFDLAYVLMKESKCEDAKKYLSELFDLFPFENSTNQLASVIYKECFKDEEKSRQYEQKYLEGQKKLETPL